MHHIVLCCKSSWYVVPFSATHTSAVFILKMLRMSVLFRIALCYHLPSPSPPPRGVVVTYSTTDDFKTSFLHFSHFSTALWDLANSRTVSFLYCIVLYCIVLRLNRWHLRQPVLQHRSEPFLNVPLIGSCKLDALAQIEFFS